MDAPFPLQGRSEMSLWEHSEIIRRMAAMPPDERMQQRLGQVPHCRILDLGCGPGRNAEWLARQGFEVYALDSSEVMVQHTRGRIAALLPPAEIEQRVCQGVKEDLRYSSEFFDFVIAMGVLQLADSFAQWQRGVSEVTRVMKPGAEILATCASTQTLSDGQRLLRINSEPHVFEREDKALRLVLLDPQELDALVRPYGLIPLSPTRTYSEITERGLRVPLEAHYQKQLSKPDGSGPTLGC